VAGRSGHAFRSSRAAIRHASRRSARFVMVAQLAAEVRAVMLAIELEQQLAGRRADCGSVRSVIILFRKPTLTSSAPECY